MKREQITLDCGITAKRWVYDKKEWLEISIYGMYNGYGCTEIDTHKMSVATSLFAELNEGGFDIHGIHIDTGCYESVDDLLLTVSRPKV